MVNFQYMDSYGVEDLLHIMELLRAPEGCPWDQEQTHQSIRRNMLEEAYEAVEAIDEGSPEHLKEELGDVLLQVVFHALMEQEAGRFDLDAVADLQATALEGEEAVQALVYGEPGYEIQGQRLVNALAGQGVLCESSLFQSQEETLRYAKENNIPRVFLVGEQTREIELEGGRQE